MQSVVEQRDNIVIFTLKNVRVEGEISAQLKAQMLIVAQPDIDALIIDIHNVESIDSSGIGAFLLANRQLRDQEIPVILCGVNDFIKSLLRITRIENQFLFFNTIDEAIAEINDEKSE